jgi:hypothetical protein
LTPWVLKSFLEDTARDMEERRNGERCAMAVRTLGSRAARASGYPRRLPCGVHLPLERVLLCRYLDSSEVITLAFMCRASWNNITLLCDGIAAIATIGVPGRLLFSFYSPKYLAGACSTNEHLIAELNRASSSRDHVGEPFVRLPMT